jgi:hypothetical protein
MKQLTSPLVLAIVVIVLWAIGGFLFPWFFDGGKPGEFGDKFGAINALFSGLAFAGVIYAILLQRLELELQREELKLTRDELHRSADAQAQAAKALSEQLRVSLLSSRLSALSSLLNSCNAQIAHEQAALITGPSRDLIILRRKYETDLKTLFAEIQSVGGA